MFDASRGPWKGLHDQASVLLYMKCEVWWPRTLCLSVEKHLLLRRLRRTKDGGVGAMRARRGWHWAQAALWQFLSRFIEEKRWHGLQACRTQPHLWIKSACGWLFSVTMDPDQARQTWSRGALAASRQCDRGVARRSSLLHFLGRNLSSIYLLPLMTSCPK